jgi:predicted alpha/beta-hydrolase family hydrolase
MKRQWNASVVLQVKYNVRRDGAHVIKIGMTTTVLKTSGEADAFLAGVKVAHLQLAAQITPLLNVRQTEHDLEPK